MADVGARIAIHRRPRDLAGRAREEIREDALCLNDAAVAEARFPRRLGQTVDERDGSAARGERKRRRDADDSGAKHDGVDSLRGHGAAVLLSRTAGASQSPRPPRFSSSVPIDPAGQEQMES